MFSSLLSSSSARSVADVLYDLRSSSSSSSSTVAPLNVEEGEDVPADESDICSCFPHLSFTERLTGAAFCFIAGSLVSFLSFGGFTQMLLGKPARFALTYSLGNALCLGSTTFLAGPVKQFRNMTEGKRIIPSAIYVFCLIATLFASVYVKIAIVIVILVIIQWIAMLCYSLSYVPYGRHILSWIWTCIFN